MADSKQIEGPAGFGVHGGPKEASQLPIKHYNSADLDKGKRTDIEGPGEKNYGQGHK